MRVPKQLPTGPKFASARFASYACGGRWCRFLVSLSQVLAMLANLALIYGMLTFTLYHGAIWETKLEPLARILAVGTAMSISLHQVLG